MYISFVIKSVLSHRFYGFSFFEVISVLAILTILFVVTLPGLRHIFISNRTDTQVNRIVAAIHFARSEAVKRGERITLCKSSNLKNCGGKWRDGQIIIDRKGRVLRAYEGLPLGDRLVWRSSFSLNDYLQFSANGFTARGQQGSFYYCSSNQEKQHQHAIIVNRTGRTRVEKNATACQEGIY